MNITNLKFTYFVIFILMMECILFYDRQLFIGIQAIPQFPTGGFWLTDIIFYFGSLVFWFLSTTYTFFYAIFSTLFNVNVPVILVINTFLATYLVTNVIYFLRGIEE